MAIDADLFPEFKKSMGEADDFANPAFNKKDGSGLTNIGGDTDDDDTIERTQPDDSGLSRQAEGEDPSSDEQEGHQRDAQGGRDGAKKSKKEGGRLQGRLQKRFDDLTYANRMMAAQLEEAHRQNALLQEARARSLEEVKAENQSLRAHTLEVEHQRTIQALKDVRESGEVDLEAQILDKLSKINAAKAQLELRPQTYETTRTPPPPVQNYGYNAAPQTSEQYGQWLERNPWANPKSASFDPKLTLEAAEIFETLDRYHNFNGMSDRIESEEYFQMANEAMRHKWGISDTEYTPDHSTPQPRASRPGVAPVARGGGNMADQYMQSGGDTGRKYGVSVDPRLVTAWRNTTIPVSPGREVRGDDALQIIASSKLRQLKNNRS
jgi:hypothetical protein